VVVVVVVVVVVAGHCALPGEGVGWEVLRS
jgi:hypothetical protein